MGYFNRDNYRCFCLFFVFLSLLSLAPPLVCMLIIIITCKFIPAASKECQQKKSIILQKYGLIQVICERVVVLVVCDQPLESSVHHCTSDTEVPMALVGPLLTDNNDIQFRGKAGQTLNKGGHILGEVDNMPTVTILSLGQSVD